jgi:hypothetical protein
LISQIAINSEDASLSQIDSRDSDDPKGALPRAWQVKLHFVACDGTEKRLSEWSGDTYDAIG